MYTKKGDGMFIQVVKLQYIKFQENVLSAF